MQHYMNHSSNLVFHCAGRGSEEGGMAKSVDSVFENNIVAHCLLGHLYNLQPYIEPAAGERRKVVLMTQRLTGSNRRKAASAPSEINSTWSVILCPGQTGIVFARNVFAFLSTQDSAGMDISVNAYTNATLADSSSLMANPATAVVYNFTPSSVPALTDPVIHQLDWNLYFSAVHNASSLLAFGWDAHALTVDPLFVEPPSTTDWNRSKADLALQPDSPAYGIPGFRPIDVAAIGLTPAFPWAAEMAASWARRGSGFAKIQAETYDRQVRRW
jgi:hypothetical protein